MPPQMRSRRISLLSKGRALSLAAPLYLLFAFIRFYVEDETAYFVITLSSVSCGILFLWAAISAGPINSRVFALIAVLFLASLTAMLSGRNNTLEVFPQLISHIGFAWALVYAKLSKRLFFYISLLVISIFFALAAVGTSPDDIFVISRNYISVIVLLSIAFYLFSCQQNGTAPSALLLLAALLIMVWATGRAGILSGAIILLGTFVISGKRFASAAMFVVVAATAYALFWPDAATQIAHFTFGLERFNKLGLESRRSYINDEYFHSVTTNFSSFVFGAPLDRILSIVDVDGNPHNSYISLHVGFGLIGIIAILWASSFALIRLARTGNLYLALMLSVALFRSAFDSTAFHGPLDVVIFYCIIFAMTQKMVREGRSGSPTWKISYRT